jgi:hypothetical protein
MFTGAVYSSNDRTFRGKIDFGETTVSYPEEGKSQKIKTLEYRLVFSEDFTKIVGG